MERGFLSQKGGRVGRGVKEKQVLIGVKLVDRTKSNTDKSTSLFKESNGTLNDANLLKEVVLPSVIDEQVGMEVQSPLVAQTCSLQSPMVEETVAMECHVVNTPNVGPNPPLLCRKLIQLVMLRVSPLMLLILGKKVAYPVVANYVRNTYGKYELGRSMFSSSTGLFSFQFSSMDRLDAMLENGPWSRYARVMIELQADVDLKDNIVVAMPKITREGHYTCNVHVEYKWKPPTCSSCKVSGHIHEECPKNTGAEYRAVPKKPNISSSGNKKKSVEPTIEVSNSNPFDILNSVDNDVEFGTKWGITNLVNNLATSSGSSYMNIDNNEEFASNTPIVEVVFDETANLRISTSGKDGSDKGYGTNSLLEQWRDSYPDNDDYDPYDDDMYENHDMSEVQSICDDLDITVRGRKKK
uniref:DUF4283 domain-containing protein n=1 Tax=Tanacetum cinerariifolium TaxID=118510 RepID=A0A699GTN8_TANCI|nr:hypothetical protein [Tanacetum cinerariifolium]